MMRSSSRTNCAQNLHEYGQYSFFSACRAALDGVAAQAYRALVVTPPTVSGIAQIAERYDAMLCDAWGVIHNGVDLFPGAGEAMTRFREERGPVIILTNAPRPSDVIYGQLDRIGLARAAYDGIVTSGDATRAAIVSFAGKRAYRLGPAKDDPLFGGLDVDFAPLEKAEYIICTGLFNDQNEDPEVYRPLLKEAVEAGLPMICANPDIIVNWGGRMLWCAGALAKIYEEFGGDVIYAGKPYGPVYDLARAAIDERCGAPTPVSKIVAVGDGVKTDIAGANAQEIDAVLVAGAGGIHEGSQESDVNAVAAMERLTW